MKDEPKLMMAILPEDFSELCKSAYPTLREHYAGLAMQGMIALTAFEKWERS